MKVNTAINKYMLEKSPDSPLKGSTRDLDFSHFSRRHRKKLSNSETFSMRFNQDASLAAVSFSDGSLQIISTMLGDKLYEVKDVDMRFPVTSLTWLPTHSESQDAQKALGSTLDGSIIRWTPLKGNSVEHIELNRASQYHTIDGRRFVVAGAQPTIDIYDEERMVNI